MLGLLGLAVSGGVLAGCGGSGLPRLSIAPNASVERWLAQRRYLIAHRGGDADWTQATSFAYRHAIAWNPLLALEASVWPTSDGVWVISEYANTKTVFGEDLDIRSTPWKTLASLRTSDGGRPMARLVDDVLIPYGEKRIVFVDNKGADDPTPLLATLERYGGPRRIVLKSYCRTVTTPTAGRAAGYRTWGYYYATDMQYFAQTQTRFDLLGLAWSAPQADFDTMHATGKPVTAHIIATEAQAKTAWAKGARGLMVSGVTQVVEHALAA